MMNTSQLRLLQPPDSTAPQAVHLIAELRELGYKLAVGWVRRSCTESDISIVDCYLAAAVGTRAVTTLTRRHCSSGGADTASCG